jgi:ssDNA-binding Zn-finger/Zn-ribbon topoisomerase 1
MAETVDKKEDKERRECPQCGKVSSLKIQGSEEVFWICSTQHCPIERITFDGNAYFTADGSVWSK